MEHTRAVNDIDVKIRERTVSESKDGNCNVCCEKVQFFAVGKCDHPICLKCSARMRVLSNQLFCAACKADLEQVVFCEEIRPFQSFHLKNMLANRKYGIRFESKHVQAEFFKLLDHRCSECDESDEIFYNMNELKSHLRKVHSKLFCDICTENLTLFPIEMKTYSKKDLVSHRKEGDKDERSHRGHPECRFCDERYFDNDALLVHLRKNHFWCHFCEHDGKQDYYNIYDDLREHFRKSHYLCDEGACQNEKFTSVFRGPIDFKAHKLAAHAKNLNKMQAKEARKVDINYSFSRHAPKGSSNITRGDYEEVQRSDNQSTSSSKGRNNMDFNGHRNNTDFNGHRKHRNSPLNFYDYDDVEKERKNFKARQHKRKDESVEGAMAASASIADNHEDVVQRPVVVDSDDDVIGLTEHINKADMKLSKQDVVEVVPKESKSVVTDTPVDETDFPSLSGSKQIPISNTYSTTHTYRSSEESFPALQPSTKKPEQPGTSAPSNKFGNHVNVKVEKKKKGKSWSKQTGRNLNSLEDFPSLGKTFEKKPPINNNTTETLHQAKKTEQPSFSTKTSKKDSTVSTERVDNNSSKKRQNLALQNNSKMNKSSTVNDPPGLDKSHISKPPPGIGKESIGPPGLGKNDKKPPPGLKDSNKLQHSVPPGLVKSDVPPGLVKSDVPPGLVKSDVPPGLVKSDVPPGLVKSDVPPGLVKSDESKMERNLRLLAMLQAILDDFNLSIFKQLSGKFRQGEITAQVYYDSIEEILSDNLKIIFSELVALLPDEAKQQELLVVHNNSKVKKKSFVDYPNPAYSKENHPPSQGKTWGALPASVVQAKKVNKNDTLCEQCGQSFPRENINEHMEIHSSEAFPALPVQVKKKKNYSFAPVHRQVPVTNAWKAK